MYLFTIVRSKTYNIKIKIKILFISETSEL